MAGAHRKAFAFGSTHAILGGCGCSNSSPKSNATTRADNGPPPGATEAVLAVVFGFYCLLFVLGIAAFICQIVLYMRMSQDASGRLEAESQDRTRASSG